MVRRVYFIPLCTVVTALPAIAFAYDDTAFTEGAGQSGVALKNAIAMMFHASVLLLAAWTIWGLAREWMDGSLGQRQLLINAVRMASLVVILGFFIR